MSTRKDVAIGAANTALAEAGLPGVHVLLAALHSSLWVMDHPDVHSIKFCGNPKEQAKRYRALIAEFGHGEQRSAEIASEAFKAPAVVDGGRKPRVESEGYQQRLAQDRQDAARFRWHYGVARTANAALVDLEMRFLNDEAPTLDEARAAFDEAMAASKPQQAGFVVPVQGSDS